MRKLALVLAVCVFGAVAVGGAPRPAEGQAPSGWVPVLITLPSRAGVTDEQAVKALGGSIRHVFASSSTISVYLPASLVEQLKKYPRFLNVREEPTVTTLEDTVPWGIPRVGADAVWAGVSGAASVSPGLPAGAGVLVAVIDTGIDKTHPDLAANIVGGRNFVRVCSWFSCTLNTSAWGDDNGHGTHVAGTIASVDNGGGFIGVAPRASIYAIKVLNSQGSGPLGDVIAGIDHAVSVGAKVINLSLGCNCNDPALKAAVDRAAAAGVLVVGAAGNTGSGTDTVGWPAKYDSVIAVAATCGTNASSYCGAPDSRASFSSTGPAVEIAAPGDQISSTYRNGGYATMSGTSMATPHIAGVAALVMSCNSSLPAAAVRAAITGTAIDLGAAGRDNHFGFGLVSANAAAASAGCGSAPIQPPGGPGQPPPDTTPPDTSLTSNPPGLTNSRSASFGFASSEPNSTFECSLDSTSAYSACTSPRAYSGLADGSHTFRVRAKDASGNTDATPATYTWTVDGTAPNTAITSAPATGTATSVSFAFSSTESGSTFACSLNSTSSYQPCTSPHNLSSLAPGQYTFRVRATDAAGNTDATPAAHTWTVQSSATSTMRVSDLDGARTLSWLSWTAQVVVTVVDQNGQRVSGASVAAAWSGAASASVTGTTNSQGQVTFSRSGLSSWSSSAASITLTVTNVTKSGFTYTAAANSDPDGDSNGTTIRVVR